MDSRDYYPSGRAGDPMPSVVDCHYRPFTQSCITAETRDQRLDPGQQPAVWSGMGMIDGTALDEACRPMATVYTFIRTELTGPGVRVARYAGAIASQLGESPEFCDQIAVAALFHDIGKISVSKTLLDKPGRLTVEEFAAVKTHTWLGARMLERNPATSLQDSAEVALLHHERFDGTGYPFGLRGEAIPLSARIVAVADVFDALRSVRSYKLAWSTEQALDYLEIEQGWHFDPVCVQAFLASSVWVEEVTPSRQAPKQEKNQYPGAVC
ncbi:MAG: HD-GYP domain-containing protein [Gammaproteobacteria bacterium]|nr:HD-GYP domain-containing protein [Gammaproteobacteria bacterium]